MQRLFLFFILILFVTGFSYTADAQVCSNPGQTPGTAFPVCGTSEFHQTNVPYCSSHSIFVPGCSNGIAGSYENKNPYFYKFTCFETGTLAFTVTPDSLNEDYDWQLYDITGYKPEDIFTVNSLVVTGNWAGSYGPTGASASGIDGIQCGSDPSQNRPTFAKSPTLIAGHEYILMISHFSNTPSGYKLSFRGGTAVITDTKLPELKTALSSCSGKNITIKLNKKIRCQSLALNGSDFSIQPAVANVIAAIAPVCDSLFETDSIILTLNQPVPNGNYDVVLKIGTDGNTLYDICETQIPVNNKIGFTYFIPSPINADSIATPGCSPVAINIHFPKGIDCTTISPDGSDFNITGPTPVNITGARAACPSNSIVTVSFASPIYTKGSYTISFVPGTDGNVFIDECGQPVPPQQLSFTTADTVSAAFNATEKLGCTKDTIILLHNRADDVNYWKWNFNNTISRGSPTITKIVNAISQNTIQLVVSNGICIDSFSTAINFNNEVSALFYSPDIICPEDQFIVADSSKGSIDTYTWNFGNLAAFSGRHAPGYNFPQNNIESVYPVTLTVYNSLLNCSDTYTKKVTVLNNCYIAVPSAFTPNGDGLNDFLYPNNAIKALQLQFRVYSRSGQLVFSSSNWQQKWNGTLNGRPQPAGVYVWFLRYLLSDNNNTAGSRWVEQKGTTTLIR